jgi:hypothetical protein
LEGNIRQIKPSQSNVNEHTPGCAHLFPIGAKLNANAFYYLGSTLKDADNVAESIPPILEIIVSVVLWDSIEFKTKCFDFIVPTSRGVSKVPLSTEVLKPWTRVNQRAQSAG